MKLNNSWQYWWLLFSLSPSASFVSMSLSFLCLVVFGLFIHQAKTTPACFPHILWKDDNLSQMIGYGSDQSYGQVIEVSYVWKRSSSSFLLNQWTANTTDEMIGAWIRSGYFPFFLSFFKVFIVYFSTAWCMVNNKYIKYKYIKPKYNLDLKKQQATITFKNI